MSDQEEFFSKKHNQPLNIASWAKYFAWIALVFFILMAISDFYRFFNPFGEPIYSNTFLFRADPGMALKMLTDPISDLLKGVIYFLVLKGISLGLYIIVETDINYREKNQGGE